MFSYFCRNYSNGKCCTGNTNNHRRRSNNFLYGRKCDIDKFIRNRKYMVNGSNNAIDYRFHRWDLYSNRKQWNMYGYFRRNNGNSKCSSVNSNDLC